MEARDLLAKPFAELDDLFKSSASGPIPSGPTKGTAIIAPGSAISRAFAAFIGVVVWKGKVFNRGALMNRVTPFGLHAIKASVYKGPSWHDQKECIVIDYSKTSLVARWIRDEIRLVSPGTYLGKVYWGSKPLIHFSLEV